MPRPHIEDCIRAILPPDVADLIRDHYGRSYLGKKTMGPFWKRFKKDNEFSDRIWRRARELMDVIFNEESESWGDWPSDPQECAGIGFIVGFVFEDSIDSMLLELPEEELSRLEEKCRSESASFWDILFDRITASKAGGSSDSHLEGGLL
jgi:hypothetical protein